jgi:dipeptidyl aminopeptidase/acylaminoacyl peptidase
VENKDGKQIVGLLYTPRNEEPDKKLPAVLIIPGGPKL